MPRQFDDVATLLMVARTEIRNLKRDAASLPPKMAAEFLARIEHLSAQSQRIARAAAQKIGEH